jgi:hypothetical protein
LAVGRATLAGVRVWAGGSRWGAGSWCPGESAVAGEQGGVHRFGECHVGRVIDGEVVP